MEANNKRPLIVDLDGTLIATDTLVESCLLYIKKHPFGILKLFRWLLGGVNKLKEELASEVIPNPELLPYRSEVIRLIQNAYKSEREIHLITGANQRIADSVSKHINLFNSATGSKTESNLKGKAKLKLINEIIGNQKFDYIGNSYSDIIIWEAALTVIVCSKSGKLKRKLEAKNNTDSIVYLNDNSNSIKNWIKELRIYQWSKNILLFLALFMSHRILELDLLSKSVIAFFTFSLIASSVYILNDLFDLESDRLHPIKKERPFASGKISAIQGLIALPILIISGFGLSMLSLPGLHTIALLVYFLATITYSLYLKEILFIDVLLLGTLYALRILAGGFATGIEVSSWLLGFSGFFFLSLAFMKRYTDLMLFKQNSQEELFGRGYNVSDADFVQKAGLASGFLSLLILALYITSEQVLLLYNKPTLLWLTLPLIFYWLMNMWYNTHKGKMSDDPIIYAIKDKNSFAVFVLVLLIMITATIL